MKHSCRILVGLQCNYSCLYCCNKLPGMLDRFEVVRDPLSIIGRYQNISISGGEPLLAEHQGLVALVYQANLLSKNVFLYTNGQYAPSTWLLRYVTGWNVGFHPSQTSTDDFIKRINSMIARLKIARDQPNLRIQVEDTESHQLQNRVPDNLLKVWKRNECDKTAIEDWFIVRR